MEEAAGALALGGLMDERYMGKTAESLVFLEYRKKRGAAFERQSRQRPYKGISARTRLLQRMRVYVFADVLDGIAEPRGGCCVYDLAALPKEDEFVAVWPADRFEHVIGLQ